MPSQWESLQERVQLAQRDTVDHIARSEQRMLRAAELLDSLHWHDATLVAQMRRQVLLAESDHPQIAGAL